MIRMSEQQLALMLKGGSAKAPSKRAASGKEGGIVASCIRWLLQHDCFIWRNNTGAYKAPHGAYIRFGLKGSSDILGTTPHGRFIAVECKVKGKYLKPEQKAFRDKVEARKGLYILARSIDDLEAMKGEILGNMGEMG